MTTLYNLYNQTKTWQKLSVRLVLALTGVGMIAVLASAPVFASGQEGEEGDEKHGSEKSKREFYGTVQKIPADKIGSWTINGREVMVTKSTRIKEEYGTAQKGAYVEVYGTKTGKDFVADKIEVKRAKK
jgi:hypothetical protein